MTRINANNHLGWGVQWLSSTGWQYTTDDHGVFSVPTQQEAEEVCKAFQQMSTIEYRVYEALTMKEQA